MNITHAISLVDSFLDRLNDDPIQHELSYKVSEVLILTHVLERNLIAASELKHGLTFARLFASKYRPQLALSRLRCTLVSIRIRGESR